MGGREEKGGVGGRKKFVMRGKGREEGESNTSHQNKVIYIYCSSTVVQQKEKLI